MLDFAGGTAVHICAAATSAMYSVFFRLKAWWWRKGAQPTRATPISREEGFDPYHEGHPQPEGDEEHEEPQEHAPNPRPEVPRPHNVINVLLGTALLWVGWLGFNGGSTLGINLRTVSALVSTNLAACSGGLAWCFLDYWFSDFAGVDEAPKPRRFSVISFCNGIVAGLVAITPAAGYVRVPPGGLSRDSHWV